MILQMTVCIYAHTTKLHMLILCLREYMCQCLFIKEFVCKLPPTAIYCPAHSLWLWWGHS